MIGGFIGKPIGGVIEEEGDGGGAVTGGRLIGGTLTKSKLTSSILISAPCEDVIDDHKLWQARSGRPDGEQSWRHTLYSVRQP